MKLIALHEKISTKSDVNNSENQIRSITREEMKTYIWSSNTQLHQPEMVPGEPYTKYLTITYLIDITHGHLFKYHIISMLLKLSQGKEIESFPVS